MGFEIVEGSSERGSAEVQQPREYSKLRALWHEFVRQVWWFRLNRWLPRLVWLGDEIDVCVTFREDRLPEGMTLEDNPFRLLFSGGLFEIEKQLHDMGISFDTGMGCGGRDWEWDWSLSGPVSLSFRGRAKHPERRVRKECAKPTLVKSN